MITIPFFKSGLLSIDIGFRNIKVIEVEVGKNSEIYIKNFGITSTPRDCIKNGKIIDVDSITKEIKKLIDDNNMKAKSAKIVMSGTNIISRIFMVDKIPGQDIDSVINSVICQDMPIDTNEYRIDYKILQELKEDVITRVKVFVTAVRKNIITSYVDVLVALRLKPLSVDIPANSTAKFFNREIKINENESWYKKNKYSKLNQNTFAVLDFGSETTIVNILRDNMLEFNKVILSGSNDLDCSIAEVMACKEQEAERLKKMYGMAAPDINSGDDQLKIYDCIKKTMDKVIVQVYHCFEFYEKRCYGTKVGKIYIVGGGSLVKGLREYLEESLQIPVYPVGLLGIDGIKISSSLDSDKLNFLINSVGITL